MNKETIRFQILSLVERLKIVKKSFSMETMIKNKTNNKSKTEREG